MLVVRHAAMCHKRLDLSTRPVYYKAMPRKPGNHGIVIPRNKRLLTRLYWKEQHSLPDIARLYDVNHKSVENVFRELGIPRRKRRTKGQSRFQKCIKCGAPVYKIKHRGNGSRYGKRCLKHKREHYRNLSRIYTRREEIRLKKLQNNYQSYYRGPKRPKGEKQWLVKSKILLRNAQRLSLGKETRVASRFPKLVSTLVRNSRL